MKINIKDINYNNFLKIILINISVFLCSIVILEIVFGNWFNPKNIKKLKIIVDRVLTYEIDHIYPSNNKSSIYTRDEFGFRGSYPNVNSINILTLGGSTTDQRYITDGETFQDVLQENFQSIGKNVYVVNAGVDGQSSYGHIKNFDYWFNNIKDLKTDYFLFYIGVNDFYKNEGYENDKMDFSELDIKSKIKNTIKSKSAIYDLIQTILNVLKAKGFDLPRRTDHIYDKFTNENWVSEPKQSNHKEKLYNRLLTYKQRLRILCDRVESFGSKSIFVTQSRRRKYDFINGELYGIPKLTKYDDYYYNGVDYYHMIRLYHESLKEICEENGSIFIDLDKELEFDIKNDFYDYTHHTPSGAEKIGDYLFKKLKHLY